VIVADGFLSERERAIQTWMRATFFTGHVAAGDNVAIVAGDLIDSRGVRGLHPFLARINSPSKVRDVPGTEERSEKAVDGRN